MRSIRPMIRVGARASRAAKSMMYISVIMIGLKGWIIKIIKIIKLRLKGIRPGYDDD